MNRPRQLYSSLVCIFLLLFKFSNVFCEELSNTPITSQDAVALGIVIKTVEKNKHDDRVKTEKLVFQKTHSIYGLDQNGQIKSLDKIEVYKVYGRNGRSVQELVSVWPRGAKVSQTIKDDEIYSALITRYYFSLGSNIYKRNDGKAYFEVRFWPKPNLEYKTRLDQVINRIAGTFYIDIETFMPWKVSASLIENFGTPFFFDMEKFNIHFEQQEFNGIGVMKYIEITTKFSYGFLFVRKRPFEKHIFTYDYPK